MYGKCRSFHAASFGVGIDSFDEDFPLVERMGRETFWRLSIRKEGNVVVDVKVLLAGKGRGRIRMEQQVEMGTGAGNGFLIA